MTDRRMTATEVFAIQRDRFQRNEQEIVATFVGLREMQEAIAKRIKELIESGAFGEQSPKQEG